jgi:DNA polymerase
MGLNLDLRQRAMLQEMQVSVWWPLTPAEALPSPPVAAVATPVAATTALFVPAASAAMTVPSPAAAAPAPSIKPAALPAAGQERLDWAALQGSVESCRACALCAGRTHTVFGVGGLTPRPGGQVPVADWLIVGEAPGEQEDLSGLPFVGPAGQLLDNMLKAVGLDRRRQDPAPGDAGAQGAQGVFIANVLKCRPPSNRNPDPAEVAQCVPYLQRQIELLQPKIILAMGRFAAQTLLHESVPDVQTLPLGKLRGRVHRYRGIPVVVTYHPAYLLRALSDKAKAWADLCLAVQVRRDAGQ